MLAVSLTASGPEIVDLPRPRIEQPGDAIVMVTTTAIGHWEIDQARGPGAFRTPGAQFAGIVVEAGDQVAEVNIDDLVVAACAGTLSDGRRARFGLGSLAGGHAEYVRVPLADRVLVRTTPAAEERTVFACGEAAMGIRAADRALDSADGGPILVTGSDAAVLSAVARIRQRRGRNADVHVRSGQPAFSAAARVMGAVELEELPVDFSEFAAIVADRFTLVTPDGIPVFMANNAASCKAEDWPSLEETRRAEMAIRLGQLDLAPLVSNVLPLDDAAEAYRMAVEQAPGVRSVLLKP